MHDPRFFGFGSLVNCATHTYPQPEPARLRDWRRIWMPTGDGDTVALSVRPSQGDVIEGLTASVPQGDWAALDLREVGYTREIVTQHIVEDTRETWVYAVPERGLPRHEGLRIRQSYLDVVLQGFLRQSGEAGVRAFFETTDGWDIRVDDDRANPIYPRHQATSPDERALFDQLRAALT